MATIAARVQIPSARPLRPRPWAFWAASLALVVAGCMAPWNGQPAALAAAAPPRDWISLACHVLAFLTMVGYGAIEERKRRGRRPGP